MRAEIWRILGGKTVKLLTDPHAIKMADQFPRSRQREPRRARRADGQHAQRDGGWVGHHISAGDHIAITAENLKALNRNFLDRFHY